MAQTSTIPPFTFYTKLELDAILAKFKADDPSYTRDIAGGNVNGESFTFSHGDVEYTRAEFAARLQAAYWELGETKYGPPPGDRTCADFRTNAYSDPFC